MGRKHFSLAVPTWNRVRDKLTPPSFSIQFFTIGNFMFEKRSLLFLPEQQASAVGLQCSVSHAASRRAALQARRPLCRARAERG